MTPASCACPRCVAMCRHSTCLPTPDEALTLIEQGYGARLARYEWIGCGSAVPNAIGPAPKGREGMTLYDTQQGACTFHLPDGRCELHDLGLKPLEGRLARHDRPWMPIRTAVLKRWVGDSYERVSGKL